MTQQRLTEPEIKKQRVFETLGWWVLFPRKPIFPYHLMLVVRSPGVQTFTGLSDKEIIGLREVVNHCATRFRSSNQGSFEGYNLFSNNGSERIGQHLGVFHQHVFLRRADEAESPFKLMNSGKHWHTESDLEWSEQRDSLRQILAE